MSAISRNAVYWFGASPTDEEQLEFKQRGLVIRIFANNAAIDFNVARAVVYNARPPGVPAASAQLNRLPTALDHGLMVFLLAADDAIQAHLLKEVPNAARYGHLMALVRSRTGSVPSYECAENIARHDVGRHAKMDLQIHLPLNVKLKKDEEFFVRRAFSDCAVVSLEPLTGGRSATTFAAQATLIASEVGPRPLPFFVKIDEASKILTEVNNYQLFATNHIPWYLRPNLDSSRCLYGLTHGILVGSFVEQSESLWQAVLNGKGPRYIHALFEDTLMGWRSQAYRHPPLKGSLINSLSYVFNWEKVPSQTVHQAKQHGTVLTPKELWEQLINLPEQRWRNAPMHGDMHAENVRVRNNDAIIIDLANARTGPLCADVASMEVWLAFEIPTSEKQIPDRAVWTQVVRELFKPTEVTRPPGLATNDLGLDWLSACIRQTRMIAGAICECDTEYPTAIALHLLRWAQYLDDSGDEEEVYRRGYAYFMGSQLVDWLSTKPFSSMSGTI
jgi:hypothetical protein